MGAATAATSGAPGIIRNPVSFVDALGVPPAEVTPLSADDARTVLAAARSQRNGARWAVALALGRRQGEALGLPWDAVDLDAGTLRVRPALQRQEGRGRGDNLDWQPSSGLRR